MAGASPERARREQVLHDLRTPLSVIKGTIEALRGHWDQLEDGRRAELLNRALTNVDGLAAAIDDVGRAARIPGGGHSGRVRLAAIEITRRNRRFAVEVSIARDGRTQTGVVESTAGGAAERRAVAEAVLRAASARDAEPIALEVAEVIEVGTDRVAAVRLSRGARALVGAALVDADDYDAIANATLHALGRVLEAGS
jgi:signal transduction histidine kinase